ncbi:MAG: AAA-like domain-containing protein [Cyanobacteriota bacterium]|nr:AAA-like domain-containing protein [Cyanobacteriota bacterium]
MISREEFEKLYDEKLKLKIKNTVKAYLKEVQTMNELAQSLKIDSHSTVSRHLGEACTLFLGKENKQNHAKLVEVFYWYKPELVCRDRLNELGVKDKLKLESTEGTVPLKSDFYVERSPIESFCYQTIIQPGALIPIKAPRQMGKSSLLDRILDRGRQEGYQTVRLNLRQISAEKFADTNTFMRCFCSLIRKELALNLPQIDELWDDEIGGASATGYLQAVLEGLENPLILGLDEVDKVFDYEDVYQYFLPLLRSWHEEANSLEIWENLRLVVVHSTEDYGRLDLNRSPFNVRSPVELRDLSPEEIADLAGRHQLNLTSPQLEDLRALIGGHPYLVRLAFYRLARGDMSLEMLLENAATDAGIYQEHLLRHFDILNRNSALKASFKQVIVSEEAVQIDSLQSRKLYSMGAIVKQGNLVMPRCPLYRQYFRERL